MIHITQGSIWQKWDLHLHPPFTQLADAYKTIGTENVLDNFCDEIESSDVLVFGITDYFSFRAYTIFIEAFGKKYPNSKKQFFFNLELRLNETVNKELEEVNIHLIFNPLSLTIVDKFLSRLKITKTGKDGVPITCGELKSADQFKSATVTRESITSAFEDTFGKDAIRQNHFLIFTAANNDGLRPKRGQMRKNELCDEIDKFSDGFIGSSINTNHFIKTDRLEDKDEYIRPKPVITGSDAHSFYDITTYLGKTVSTIKDINGATESILKETTWIKADPSFEGLKQLLYEPVPGERVFISSAKPDQKDEFKIIRKIKFANSNDFPSEVVFNGNLSSIIGSRSSGKSALLAYIAYAVDPIDAKNKVKGPGEGEPYHWNNLKSSMPTVEWANGKTASESLGKVIYLPQNYLFDKSKEAKEVKERIAPVLFNLNPTFKISYDAANFKINELNNSIGLIVDEWFKIAANQDAESIELKNLGDKKSIEEEKISLEQKVKDLKIKSNFDEEDLAKYRLLADDLAKKRERINVIIAEENFFGSLADEGLLFKSVQINTLPALSLFPETFQKQINKNLTEKAENILIEINRLSTEYKEALASERTAVELSISHTQELNNALIERYNNNAELQKLMKDLARQNDALAKISTIEESKSISKQNLISKEKVIKANIMDRMQVIESLKTSMETSTQKDVTGIQFGLEYDLDKKDLEMLATKINTRDRSEFVDQNQLQFEKIRSNPEKFILAMHLKTQKLIQGQNPVEVVKSALQLSEKILFTADMEGDKIGGFKEPTMTPGKRALFALRLILAESNDQWPLLIDQPEDDLDSRSIYDEIVPFLKQKKKERQIIMVSHNANLVIGADSEQLIIANRNGSDRKNADGKQFNFLTGSLEHTIEFDKNCSDTLHSQGVCEHACSILDGGKTAFENRKNKYNL